MEYYSYYSWYYINLITRYKGWFVYLIKVWHQTVKNYADHYAPRLDISNLILENIVLMNSVCLKLNSFISSKWIPLWIWETVEYNERKISFGIWPGLNPGSTTGSSVSLHSFLTLVNSAIKWGKWPCLPWFF